MKKRSYISPEFTVIDVDNYIILMQYTNKFTGEDDDAEGDGSRRGSRARPINNVDNQFLMQDDDPNNPNYEFK